MTAPSITTRILRLVVEQAPISQSGLKKLSGLSMSAVSQATNRLLAKGLIQELGLRRVSMGRPKMLLGLTPDYANVIGVQLNADRNLIIMTDLSGNLISEQQLPSGELSPKQLSDALAKFLNTNRDKHIGAIGLAISGLVDPNSGECLRSTVLNWTRVPIAQQLTERFNIPVYIENDANAMAQASLVFGQLGQAKSAIITTYGQGIGAGIIINRQLYRGNHGTAGEIGSALLADGSGKVLEDVASTKAILSQLADDPFQKTPLQHLQELDHQPSELALEVLTQAGHYLGIALANLATAFDPEVVYLVTEPQMASRILLDQVTQSFQQFRLKLAPQLTPLQFIAESRMSAQGAAGLAVNRLIDEISSEM
ncbi:ROK family transcriptional regulator [Celerinatantimonas diazotrophica]|uniref:Putative NBD/HSP70 family sugar kinase n=1 Tax=Celerinatantimonas diazotrophica TaxID=412034 RepID=A0A4R1K181_9GAMM|nr:ROK family transcriptional regulator [Celerinatantimonas diazotrophica]TCK57724.1 putative NBD/HSP70 family sugar kinase [Celerinatantimonas diazotrophica]CAG9298214.1 N-acetylglucosamine repressor [Celerinatantimonas diazotrophica]